MRHTPVLARARLEGAVRSVSEPVLCETSLMERTIRVIKHVSGPLKDTIVEVVEDDGGALHLVALELHVSFDSNDTGTVKDITPAEPQRDSGSSGQRPRT